MEALKEITMIGLVLAVAFLLGNIIVNLYWRWYSRKDAKISEDYRKAVEKHQLSDMKMSTYPDPPKRKTYIPTNKDINRSEAFTNSVPSQLVDSNFNLWGHGDSIISSSSGETQIHNANGHYSTHSGWHDNDGAGHGGSFGGGGASGSWGSDDNNSSSSYDSSSSDSGGSDSSSSD